MIHANISIVEDVEETIDFLKDIFQKEQDFTFQNSYQNAEDAIAFLPRSEANVVIVDIGLGKDQTNGIDCVRRVKAIRPDIQFMMYTVFDRDDAIFESLKAGASGYLLKSTTDENKILTAVRELVNGGSPMSPDIARRVTEFFFNPPNPKIKELDLLSHRERELLELLSQGLLYKEIADQLGIKVGTVKQHIHNIYQKLHVQNRMEAVNIYLGREKDGLQKVVGED